MLRTALVSLAAVAGSSLVASAGEPLLFTQDSRQTSASSEMLFTDDTSLMQSDATVPATLFTAFDASDLAIILQPNGDSATGLAVMDSGELGDAFTVTGFVEAAVNIVDGAQTDAANAQSESLFDADFQTTDGLGRIIRITGSVRAESPSDGTSTQAFAFVRLGNRTVSVDGNGEHSFDLMVNIGAGPVSVHAEAAASAEETFGNPGQAEADFVLSFSVVGTSCGPSDIAEPFGVNDLNDIAAFVNGFLNQDVSVSDLSGDGLLGLEDISAFATSFLKTCI